MAPCHPFLIFAFIFARSHAECSEGEAVDGRKKDWSVGVVPAKGFAYWVVVPLVSLSVRPSLKVLGVRYTMHWYRL